VLDGFSLAVAGGQPVTHLSEPGGRHHRRHDLENSQELAWPLPVIGRAGPGLAVCDQPPRCQPVEALG